MQLYENMRLLCEQQHIGGVCYMNMFAKQEHVTHVFLSGRRCGRSTAACCIVGEGACCCLLSTPSMRQLRPDLQAGHTKAQPHIDCCHMAILQVTKVI
jgi:hypothetical protein